MLNAKGLEAAVIAHDNEENAQRGEPKAWIEAPVDDQSGEWSERIVCMEVAITAYLQAVGPEPAVMRTGDHVYHAPSDETWVVAWADHKTGYMSPCGWPECQAKISDCTITKRATDDESNSLVERLSKSGRRDADNASRIRSALVATPPAEPVVETLRQRLVLASEAFRTYAKSLRGAHATRLEVAKELDLCADATEAEIATKPAAKDDETVVEALRKAEQLIVKLYRGCFPQANYDHELTINGHVAGNRFADNDETVVEIRAALAAKDGRS